MEMMGINYGEMKFYELANYWLEEYAERALRERTIERLSQFKARTYAAIGDMIVKDIKPLHLQKFVDELGKPGVNQRTGGGLSPKTIRGYLNFVSDVMTFAWRLEGIESNPCKRVSLPPLKKKPIRLYTMPQTTQFFRCLKKAPIKYQAFYELAIFAGFRRGELLGLEWADIDFNNHIINVERSIEYSKRKGIFVEEAKTEAGNRVIKLPAYMFQRLKQLRASQVRECFFHKVEFSESMHLFTSKFRCIMHPNTPYNWAKRFCLRNRIPFYGIHQFRHMNASLLINGGTDVRTVAYALGHAQVSTTLNIYAHEFAVAQAKASAAAADIIENKIFSEEEESSSEYYY